MTPFVEKLCEELAPVLVQLIDAAVTREVARVVREGVPEKVAARREPARVMSWRGAYVDGAAYGEDAFVVRDDRLFCAIRATVQPPALQSPDWILLADREH